MQRQRSFEWDSWHSVGHLRTTNVVHGGNNGGDNIALPRTQMHGGDSRNPASCVSGRHIVGLKDRLERPPCRVGPGGVASMNERRLSSSLGSQDDGAGDVGIYISARKKN